VELARPERSGGIVGACLGELRPLAEVTRQPARAATAVAFEPAQLALAIGLAHGAERTSAAGAAILARAAILTRPALVLAAPLRRSRRGAVVARTPVRP
jgi:hypothetical protein